MITVNFRPGDMIRVHQRIQEGDKTRTQVFQGTVLGIKGRGENQSFIVRKLSGAVAVERIWPVASPAIEKIELVANPKKTVKRAKLYHLRTTK